MGWYMAGPLFTEAERQWNEDLAAHLRANGVHVFLPQEQERRAEGFPSEAALRQAVFRHDVHDGLERCHGVLANLDGPGTDDGTAWEVGWAYARGYSIVGYRTDFRGSGDGFGTNIMLSESCDELIVLPSCLVSRAEMFQRILAAVRRWEARSR
jgi:nucleoside 2-deoxyribosyltransferase